MDDHSPGQIPPQPKPDASGNACGSPYPGEACTHAEGRALPPVSMDAARLAASTALRRSSNHDEASSVPPLPPVCEASSPTSLDTTETSVRSPIEAFLAEKPSHDSNAKLCLDTWLNNTAVRFRHSGWWDIRQKVFKALERTGQSSSRLSSFASCGGSSWIQQNKEDPSRFRLSCNHCHDRLCTPCANQRSFRLAEALHAVVKDKPTTFITLTLCGKKEPLAPLIDRLYRSFRNLRAHPIWDKVTGGAAFLEVKWSDKAQRWHPHLHIICEAGFIDQGELSDVWRGITKDSFIVDIRKVRDSAVTSRYVTKYASKPLNTSFANDAKLLDEAVLALKGRRLCLCFGTWYGTPLDLAEDTEFADDLIDAAGWTNVRSLEECLDAANAGDPASIALIRLLNCEAKWIGQLRLK